ncbi:MAG TPA: GNAT family N-acetyltransferase [Candidatus Woesebacteria bacterium]|nr:GNAT family N-acetyltransferase [Candidatus Woesebacteria bacterium]
MKTFTPGIIVHEFITKNGRQATIRYPQLSDIESMTEYVNTLSAEDIYVSLSGEQFTPEEEQAYLEDQFHKIEDGDGVILVCTVDGNLAGICDVTRNQRSKRSMHLGIFGISLHKEYRGQGLGRELAQATIYEAKLNIDGLKIITLSVYKPNTSAHELYKKLGFVEYGLLPEGTIYKDEFIDKILMYLTV